jgi:hypothetical protein
MRRPFNALAEGLVSEHSRDDWIRTKDLLNAFLSCEAAIIRLIIRFSAGLREPVLVSSVTLPGPR